MAQAHNHPPAIAFPGLSANFQLLGQALLCNDQRMIARRGEWLRQVAENRPAIMLDMADLSMHHLRGADHGAAKSGADCLMTKTHAQYRFFPGEMANQFDADAGLTWRAWPGRDKNVCGIQVFDIRDADLIITAHLHGLPHFAQILHQVVSKGIVVVQNKDHESTLAQPLAPNESLSTAAIHKPARRSDLFVPP